MMKRILGGMRRALSLVLAVALLCGLLTVFPSGADVGWQYLSELRICIATSWDEAAAELRRNGYEVSSQNLNMGSGGGTPVVCLGFKTTSDPTQALTDIAILNMNASYAYTDIGAIERLCGDELDAAVDAVQTAVAELRRGYAAESPVALWAYDALNDLHDAETDRDLGWLLYSGADDATVRRILTEGNLTVLTAVFSILYLGNGTEDGRALISRLTDTGELPDADEAPRSADSLRLAQSMLESWSAVGDALRAYRNATVKWDAESDTVAAYMLRLNDRELGNYLMGGAFDAMAGETLAELFARETLTATDLLFVADAMSEGQRAVAPYLSPELILFGSHEPTPEESTDSPSDGSGTTETQRTDRGDPAQTGGDDPTDTDVSTKVIYPESDSTAKQIPLRSGVRDILYDAGGVALTGETAAYTERNAALEWLWDGEVFTEELDEFLAELYDSCFTAGMQSGYGIVFPAQSAAANADTAKLLRSNRKQLAKTDYPLLFVGALTGLAVSGADAIASLSAGALVAVQALYAGTVLYQEKMPSYRVVPGNVIQLRKEQTYMAFDAVPQTVMDSVKLTAEDGTETLLSEVAGVYGDVNAWFGYQWSVLYTTKDSSAGQPIYARNFGALADQEQAALERNVVRAFDSRLSYNLNWYAQEDWTDGGLYLYFDRAQNYEERTTTVFSRLDLCLALGGASAGGIIIGAVAVYVGYETRRKRSEDRLKLKQKEEEN